MSVGSIVALVIVIALLLYVVVLYNGLVALKHNAAKALANINVLLKQRHDELPKLVETCRQYMQYEQQTLERVIAARDQVASAQQKGDIDALGRAEGSLRSGLGQLFALAENYPELKANETFQHLQQRISGLENAIADRRETYNESVNNNNIRVAQFPDLVVARLFSFGALKLLQFSSAETRDVDMRKLFS